MESSLAERLMAIFSVFGMWATRFVLDIDLDGWNKKTSKCQTNVLTFLSPLFYIQVTF